MATTARATAETRIVVTTSAPGLAVEPVDPTDCLSPAAWLLVGTTAPLVRLVEPLPSAGDPVGGASTFALNLDGPLTPGALYLLSLAYAARSFGGLTTSQTAVVLTGPLVVGIASQTVGLAGGDIAFPVAVGGGDLTVVDRLTALQNRVSTMLAARRDAFAHLPGFGRSLEAKRTYSQAQLQQAVSDLKTYLLLDPDVAQASVTTTQVGHVASFAITVKPTFAPDPIKLTTPILAGGSR